MIKNGVPYTRAPFFIFDPLSLLIIVSSVLYVFRGRASPSNDIGGVASLFQ